MNIATEMLGGLFAIGFLLDLIQWQNQSIIANRFLDWWQVLHDIDIHEAVRRSMVVVDENVSRWFTPNILGMRSSLIGAMLSFCSFYCVCIYRGTVQFVDLLVVGPWWMGLLAALFFFLPGFLAYLLTRFFIKALAGSSNLWVVAFVLFANYLFARLIAALALGLAWSVAMLPIWYAVNHPEQHIFTHDEVVRLSALLAQVMGIVANVVFIPSSVVFIAAHACFVAVYFVFYLSAQAQKILVRLLGDIIMQFANNIFTLIATTVLAVGTLIISVLTHAPASWIWNEVESRLQKMDGTVGGAVMGGVSYLLSKLL